MPAYVDSDQAILKGSGEPERLKAFLVSVDLFATLGIAPAIGRAFTPEEDTVSGAPVVILSNGLWRRRFGSDPHVIGRAITLDNQSRTVIGIMPPGFRFPEGSDLWIPLALNVNQKFEEGSGGVNGVRVIARLKPGMTLEAARANLPVIRERKREPSRGPARETVVDVSISVPRKGAPAQQINAPPERADGQVTVMWLRES